MALLSIQQALELIAQNTAVLPAEHQPVLQALGRILAEDVPADVDSPPHDKALVDGFAVRLEDLSTPESAELRIVEQITAGDLPTRAIEKGETSAVMTGAPIPPHADAMVMVEDTQVQDDRMRYHGPPLVAGQHIMRRATTFGSGETVLRRGATIRAIEVGLLCEVGRHRVHCVRTPRVAVLPTGEELVPVSQIPGPGAIRNSNGPMLAALAQSTGCEVQLLDPVGDHVDALRAAIEMGLQYDVLILSGGVSAGTRDLVPPTLVSLGVQEIFHKVALKPGKPLWFGKWTDANASCLVFGLPGNPISSLACFKLFVRHAIRRLGGNPGATEWCPVRLASDFTARGQRPTLWPATWSRVEGRLLAEPLPWRGSADMLTVSQADCFVFFPECPQDYAAGTKLQAIAI